MAKWANSGQAGQNATMNDWRKAIKHYYPEWETQTYSVPPVYFNRPKYKTGHVAGLDVLVQQRSGGHQLVSTSPQSSASQPAANTQPVSASQTMSSQDAISKPASTQPASANQTIPSQGTASQRASTQPNSPSPAVSSQPEINHPASRKPASASPAVSSQPSPSDFRPFLGKPVRVQETDSRDDFSQQHVLFNLQALGQKQSEPMFIVTQLNYRDYLNKPAYAQAAACLPRPVDLSRPDCDGDFDFLLPHLRSGIALLELKSVGIYKPQPDAVVAKKVDQAARQLDKSGRVVRYILQDIAPGVRIVKAIVLPYVTSQQLERVLMADSNLQQAVCATLDVNPPDVVAAVNLCLCADQLSNQATPHDVTDHTLEDLSGWFRRRVSEAVDPVMNTTAYLDILARLVGPASTMAVHCVTPPRVEVRTLGEAVSELGERLARVVLTPAQLSLLNRVDSLPRVSLVGPPGTGKTLMLVLVGLHWLRKGHNVIVLSTWYPSLAVSRVIVRQLVQTQLEVLTLSAGTVRLCHFDLLERPTDVEAAIQSLAATATGHTLHVLMDEVMFDDSGGGPTLHRLVDGLSACIPGLHLWTACTSDHNIPPTLQAEPLTVPLRSAPAIVREVRLGIDEFRSDIPSYTDSGVASPSDGPTVIRLRHEGEQHAGRWPVDCRQCGLEAGAVLKHQLHVGVTGPSSQSSTSKSTTTSPPPLQYRDVLVLTLSMDFTDERRDNKGHVVTPASGFVRGLRLAEIPVVVISPHDDDDVLEKALADLVTPQADRVVLTNRAFTQGLERKVVVYLPGRRQDVDDGFSFEELEAADRLVAVSRCSSQLVWVHMPQAGSALRQDDDDDDDNDDDGNDELETDTNDADKDNNDNAGSYEENDRDVEDDEDDNSDNDDSDDDVGADKNIGDEGDNKVGSQKESNEDDDNDEITMQLYQMMMMHDADD